MGMAGGNAPQAPAGSPMSKPEPKKGLKAGALANMRIAQNMLEQALTAFAPEDAEYKTILDCLTKLTKTAGKNDAGDLVPAEVMRMVGQMPQMGGGTQMQRAIMQQLKGGGPPAQGAAQPGAQVPQPQPQGAMQ
jgi:hypothetical protein